MLTYVFALAVGIWFAMGASSRGRSGFLWFILGVAVYLAGHFGGGVVLKETVFEGGIRITDKSFETKMWTFAGLSVLFGLVVSFSFRALFLKDSTTSEDVPPTGDGTD